MTNVHRLIPETLGENYRGDTKTILTEALDYDLEQVVVIGRDENGDLFIDSSVRAADTLWLLKMVEHQIIGGRDD